MADVQAATFRCVRCGDAEGPFIIVDLHNPDGTHIAGESDVAVCKACFLHVLAPAHDT